MLIKLTVFHFCLSAHQFTPQCYLKKVILSRLCSQIQTAAAKSLQSCPTLCDPIDGSPPGSPVPGILQARTLKWVAISFSNAWKWKVKVKSLSRVRLFATPWTAAYQAPLSMGFSRQEYWSGVPLPSPGWLLLISLTSSGSKLLQHSLLPAVSVSRKVFAKTFLSATILSILPPTSSHCCCHVLAQMLFPQESFLTRPK